MMDRERKVGLQGPYRIKVETDSDLGEDAGAKRRVDASLKRTWELVIDGKPVTLTVLGQYRNDLVPQNVRNWANDRGGDASEDYERARADLREILGIGH